MDPWHALIYGAIALLATAFLYVSLRWRRSPKVIKGLAFIAGACFFSGILTGIWIFHVVSQKLEVAPQAARPAPAASTSQAVAAVTSAARPTAQSTPQAVPSVAARETAPALPADWLGRINFYRSLAKLPPVLEDTKLSSGDLSHARYLVKNRVPVDSRMHQEDPTNRWFTAEGLAAAQGGDVIPPCLGCAELSTAEAIDTWIRAPFHRILIFNPALKVMGYGEFEEGGLKAHVLGLPAPAPISKRLIPPIAFPGDRTVVPLHSFNGFEWPAALTTCAGFSTPTGLPITLQLGGNAPVVVEHHSFSEAGHPLEHCVFDASSYANPSRVEQQWGRNILTYFGAVVLIPRAPLMDGHRYTVDVIVSGQRYSWSFSIAP